MDVRRRLPTPLRATRRGFTLIEILVVLVVIAVVSSVVLLSLGVVADDRDVQREARRMSSLIELAADEAELQGRDFGVEFIRAGYRFVEYDPFFERWAEIIGDDVFRPRNLPEGYELDLFLEGRRIQLNEFVAEIETEDDEDAPGGLLENYAPHALILSSGDLSPFEIDIIRDFDEATVRVRVLADSSVRIGEEDDEDG